MHSEGQVRKFNQGYSEQDCAYCKKPMTVARGTLYKEFDEHNNVIREWTNNDPRAIYHGACRTEGRRMANKQRKAAIKANIKLN